MKKIYWILLLAAIAMPLAGIATGDEFNHDGTPYEMAVFKKYLPIDRLSGDEIVVEDRDCVLAVGVHFVDENGSSVDASSFAVGDKVRFALNQDGEVSVVWVEPVD